MLPQEKEINMEKKTIFRIISIILVVIAIFAAVCAATTTGSGFLDLSNIVKTICVCVAVVCAVLSAVMWKISGK